MALWLALQLLMVVEGEPVQDRLLLLVHGGHGALLVDLVDVNGLLALQDGIPPVLTHLAQVHLEHRAKTGVEEEGRAEANKPMLTQGLDFHMGTESEEGQASRTRDTAKSADKGDCKKVVSDTGMSWDTLETCTLLAPATFFPGP